MDQFMDALAKLFSAGISEQPQAVAIAVCKGLDKGQCEAAVQYFRESAKLQCSVRRMSGHEIQLFEIEGGYERFGYALAGKAHEN